MQALKTPQLNTSVLVAAIVAFHPIQEQELDMTIFLGNE
ncbi:hypothetical protein AVDCRST_MAG81-1563 [uncultured Synechococcales cyanobacterium]|uniref:Uncharacterized protein n=1 Tax=uncultured Synechococcales cyanobacterium TaxID=1936017 RepID=A0A6J4V5C0_9CYAN|nr:hypothetical protein AVDCRST_MAG81-1563 [uncultured Synechococcales cyanobacterium]